MRSFSDTKGNRWTLAIDYLAKCRIHQATGISLLSLLDKEVQPFLELISDEDKSIAVVAAIIEPQLAKANVTKDQFFEALAGDVIADLQTQLSWAIVDFFPVPGRREALQKVLTTWHETNAQMIDKARTEAETIDPKAMAGQLVREFERQATSAASAKSGDSPASSASSPGV